MTRQEYMKQYLKKYKELHKDEIREKQKLKRQTDEEARKKHNQRSRDWVKTHPEYRLWKGAKDSSKQRGLDFDIEQSDIIIPKVCPYLNIELTNYVDGKRHETNISLDRIDNTKGYVKGNIQVISSKANFMKRNASIEELCTFARGILALHAAD